MKRKLLERKLVLQVLSILMAAVLWFVVTYTEDPFIRLPVNNIPITYYGEGTLEKNGLLLVNRESIPSAALEVKGKRSDVRSALGSIRATVDLSEIYEPGSYERAISYDIPNSSVTVVKKRAETVDVEIEAIEKKTVPIVVLKTGEDRNKEFLVKSTAKESSVTISGAKEDIEKIYAAAVTVAADTIVESQEKSYPISYIDKNKSALTPKHAVKSGVREVTVTNTVYLRKLVPITLAPRSDTEDYQVSVRAYSKERIEIGVSREQYDSIAELYVDFAEEITMEENKKYKMKLIVPEGVYCPDKDAEFYMTADVEPIVMQATELTVEAENVPDGMTVSFEKGTVAVELNGAKNRLSEVRAQVDLSGMAPGRYTVPVKFSIPDGVTVLGETEVIVILR